LHILEDKNKKQNKKKKEKKEEKIRTLGTVYYYT